MWRGFDMEQFKKRLSGRIVLMAIASIIIGGIYALLFFDIIGLPDAPGFIRWFSAGIFLVIEVFLLVYIFKYKASINNEQLLNKIYIAENDERTRMILQRTGATGMTICNIALAFATVVAGFFNTTVFYTLLAVTAFVALVKLVFKIYYRYKY
jgi:magnesium-transporting ATPase (P-type)